MFLLPYVEVTTSAQEHLYIKRYIEDPTFPYPDPILEVEENICYRDSVYFIYHHQQAIISHFWA